MVACSFNTRIGLLSAYADELGIMALVFPDTVLPKNIRGDALRVAPSEFPYGLIDQLNEYLLGFRREFDAPISPMFDAGYTPFQRAVWTELRRIPYGCAVTYTQLAQSIDHKNAYRAVGSANGRNPIAIIIPCHRVVAAHGLGGYGGGLNVKRALLSLEGITL